MIYVGTCGYSYKDWIGSFYPGSIRQEELLRYYSACFGAVEIDASYYGVLKPQAIAGMNARTPPGFRFCFKVPQTVSHPPEAAMSRVHGDAQAFVESVQSVIEAGKFGCALLQFPNGFRPSERAERYLRDAIESLRPLPLVAEFRNREWQRAEYYELLRQLGVGWCNVDMPSYEALMRPGSDVSSSIAYVRFHGRNASTWWTGSNVTRYDYDYSEEELLPWTDRVADMEEQAEQTFAFFNNHARGNAARNAQLFADLLCERYGESAPSVMPARSRPPGQGNLFE